MVCGYHLAILRPRPPVIDVTYLFYALSAAECKRQFHSLANGVTRFGLRKADIGLVEVPLPPIPEQRAIAHILGTLDDKIELNRRMNETLEEMARPLQVLVRGLRPRARQAGRTLAARRIPPRPPGRPMRSLPRPPGPLRARRNTGGVGGEGVGGGDRVEPARAYEAWNGRSVP